MKVECWGRMTWWEVGDQMEMTIYENSLVGGVGRMIKVHFSNGAPIICLYSLHFKLSARLGVMCSLYRLSIFSKSQLNAMA